MNLSSPYISYISKEIDESRMEYGLTIQVSLGGFSFVLHDNQKNVMALQGYESAWTDIRTAINDFSENIGIKPDSIAHIVCLLDNADYSVVPSAFYDDSKASAYLDLCSATTKTMLPMHELVDAAGCEVVFGVTQEMAKLGSECNKMSFTHSTAVLMKHLLPQNKGLRQFVNVRSNDFDIMIVDNDKLLLFNSFNYGSVEDFVYYIMAVRRQYAGIEDIDLSFVGKIMPDSEVVKMTKRYVSNVSFLEPTNIKEGIVLEDMPKHYFYVPLIVC